MSTTAEKIESNAMSPVADDAETPNGAARPHFHDTSPELLFVTLGIASLIAVQFVIVGATSLLGRWFWLDELFTVWLVESPTMSEMLSHLRSGFDGSTPTYPLLIRFWHMAGATTETTYRLFPLGCMVLTLVGAYALLRLAVDRLAALGGVLFLWCNVGFINFSVELRPYSLWTAAITWYAYLLATSRRRPSTARACLLGATSVLACTIHHLGPLAWALVTFGDWLFHRSAGTLRKPALVAIVSGPALTIVTVIAFLLPQRSSHGVTWIPPLSLPVVLAFLKASYFHYSLPAWLVVLGTIVARFAALRGRSSRTATNQAIEWSGLAGAFCLAFLAPTIIVASYVLQPLLVARYGLVSALATGLLVGVLLSTTSRWWKIVCCLWLVLLSSWELRRYADYCASRDRYWQELASRIEETPTDHPVVFSGQHALYPICQKHSALRDRCFQLDIDDRRRIPRLSRFMIQHGRIIERLHEWPRNLELEKLIENDEFYVVHRASRASPNQSSLHARFPGFEVESLTPLLHRLRRAADSSEGAADRQREPVP